MLFKLGRWEIKFKQRILKLIESNVAFDEREETEYHEKNFLRRRREQINQPRNDIESKNEAEGVLMEGECSHCYANPTLPSPTQNVTRRLENLWEKTKMIKKRSCEVHLIKHACIHEEKNISSESN